MGPFCAKPPRPALQDHPRGSQAAPTRGLNLRANAGGDRSRDEASSVMKWILNPLRRRRINRELAEEVESHIQEKIADLTESGMSEQAARQQAKREFGNATLYTELMRDAWGWRWL